MRNVDVDERSTDQSRTLDYSDTVRSNLLVRAIFFLVGIVLLGTVSNWVAIFVTRTADIRLGPTYTFLANSVVTFGISSFATIILVSSYAIMNTLSARRCKSAHVMMWFSSGLIYALLAFALPRLSEYLHIIEPLTLQIRLYWGFWILFPIGFLKVGIR